MSDTPQPKFQVGEEVILIDRTETIRAEVVVTERKYGDREDIHTKEQSKGYVYVVDPDPCPGLTPWWGETALRKKYKPGEDFDTLMNSLKSPTPEKVFY